MRRGNGEIQEERTPAGANNKSHPVQISKKSSLDSCVVDGLKLEGYHVSRVGSAIAIALTVLTAGIAYLIAYWRPDWRLALTHRRAKLVDADTVLVLEPDGREFVCKVKQLLPPKQKSTEDSIRYFIDRKETYVFNPTSHTFHKVLGLLSEPEWWPSGAGWAPGSLFPAPSSTGPSDTKPSAPQLAPRSQKQKEQQEKALHMTCGQVFEVARGVDHVKRELRLALYGPNEVSTTITPIPLILLKEVLTPFYIFQVISLGIWFADEYYYFASCVVIMTLISLVSATYAIWKVCDFDDV
jgi:cation-transporting ATPase 13A2